MKSDGRRCFGATLRKCRSAAGVSLGKLSAHLGVTVVYLSNVELSKSAPLTAGRIRQAAELIGNHRELLLASMAERGTIEIPAPETGFGRAAMSAVAMRYKPGMPDSELRRLFFDVAGMDSARSEMDAKNESTE